jgi:hypothetical protein
MVSKMHSVRLLLLGVAYAWPWCLLRVQALTPRLDHPAIKQRITKLLGQMTLEEKIGQLVHFSADSANGPGTCAAGARSLCLVFCSSFSADAAGVAAPRLRSKFQ